MALAAFLFHRGRPGARAAWALVAAACALIAVDKAVDFQTHLHALGQQLVARIDPGTSMRGEHVWMRLVLLGGLVLGGCAVLVAWLRFDSERRRAKQISLAGLALILAYLGARLVPSLKEPLAPPRGWVVEGLAWALVVGGELAGIRAAGSPKPVPRV